MCPMCIHHYFLPFNPACRALALEQLGQFNDAAAALRRGLQLEPEHQDLRAALQRCVKFTVGSCIPTEMRGGNCTLAEVRVGTALLLKFMVSAALLRWRLFAG